MWKTLCALAVVFVIAGAINLEEFKKKHCFEKDGRDSAFVCQNFSLSKVDLDEMARSDFEFSNGSIVQLQNCRIDYFNENLVSMFPHTIQLSLIKCIVSMENAENIVKSTKKNSVSRLHFDTCEIRDNLNSLAFSKLRDLQTVNIQNSTLQYPYIDETFVKKDQFEFSLSIEHTKVNFQNELLSKVRYLNRVSCYSCQLKEIDSLFRNKTTAKEVSFAGNQLTHFPQSLNNQELLELIDLSENQIEEEILTRAHFKGMRSLNGLNLSRNKKISAIGYLAFEDTKLMFLSMSYVSLFTFDRLGGGELQNIHFSHNKISGIKSQVFEGLSDLYKLDLSYNVISKLDETAFKGLDNLKDLNLKANQLEELPKDIFSYLQQLDMLDLSNNHLKIIYPDSFFPKTLTWLNISNNPFAVIEKTYFTNLVDLETLDVSNATNSQTTHFDSQIFKSLKSLIELKMRNNRLKNIDGIFLPTKLESIDLGFNEIADISQKTLEPLHDLKSIILTGNPIGKEQLDLLKAGFSKIRFYNDDK